MSEKIIFLEEQKQLIINKYYSGISQIEIAKELKISPATLKKNLINWEIRFRDSSKRCKKLGVDSKYFEKIDTPNKAYFLGLFYADGNVSDSNNTCELLICGDEEKELLNQFRIDCQYTGEIRLKKKLQKRFKQPYRIAVCDKEFKSGLIKNGCVPKKSLILMFPNREQVSECLMSHFLRGMVDGDGSISFKKNGSLQIGILTSLGFANGFKSFIDNKLKVNVGVYNNRRNKLIAEVKIGGLDGIKLLNYLYKDAILFLRRKKKNFENFLIYYKQKLEKASGYWGLDQNYVKELCEVMEIEYSEKYRYKYTEEIRKEIINKYINGESKKDLGNQFNCSNTMINRILKENNISIRSSNKQRYLKNL